MQHNIMWLSDHFSTIRFFEQDKYCNIKSNIDILDKICIFIFPQKHYICEVF